MAINNFGLLQPNQPLTEADKLLADINNFNNTVVPNLPPLVTPPVNVPKYTQFGNRLATLGGFGDQQGELLTQNELSKMNQDQIDAYNKTRKRARTQGIGELLIRFGDALQGKNATQLAYGRQQVRDEEQVKLAYEQAIKIAEASGDFRKANLLRSLGLPGFQILQQEIARSKLIPKTPPKKSKSDYIVEILEKIKIDPTYGTLSNKFSPSDQNIMDVVSNTDEFTKLKRAVLGGINTQTNESSSTTNIIPTVVSEEDYKKLNDGDKFIYNGVEYTKGE